MKAEPATFYVPIEFDSSMFDQVHLPYAQFFLNLLHWKWICWRADKNNFIYLKYDYLIRIVPRTVWREVKETLVKARIVETDKTVIAGEKCLGFRVTPKYWKTRKIECQDSRLNKRIRIVFGQDEKRSLPVHRWLKDKLDLVEFDMELAEKIILTLRPDDPEADLTEYREVFRAHCQKIVDKEHIFICDKYGRVHTLLTFLPKELRRCIKVNGRNLVGLDLKNSQPLIVGVFARQYYRGGMTRSRFLSKSFDGRENPYCRQEIEAMKEQKQSVPGDLIEYIKVCEAGRFYQSMMKKGEDKETFKVQFFQNVLFGKNCYKGPMKDRFAVLYPSVTKVLGELKRWDYRRSAWTMQNYESTVFIELICGRLKRERPRVIVFTIHDCILTLPENVAYVESVVLSEWEKLGVKPGLHRERYDEIRPRVV